MKALTFSSFGSPGVLEYKEVKDPVLQTPEILVEMKAIGLNFADIDRRRGGYPVKGQPPYITGYEGAGVVIDSNNHPGFKPGDRIGFADVPFANAGLVAVPVSHAIPLPEGISFEIAAAVLLQGLTAHYLVTDSHQVKAGETVLIHAAAGGVGQLLIQICKMLGATVIGLTSAENKKEIALSVGADVVFLYQENWQEKVFGLYPDGVDVVYDGTGKTLKDSLAVIKKCRQVVYFGKAGGDPELIDPVELVYHSKGIIGGDLWDYLTSGEERTRRAAQLFGWILDKKVIISPLSKFALSEGKQAHEFLESRASTGKIIMIP